MPIEISSVHRTPFMIETTNIISRRSKRIKRSKRKQSGGAIRSGSRLPGDEFVRYAQVGSSYRYVTNPKTGRKLDIFGKKGKEVLGKFFKEGGMKMPKY